METLTIAADFGASLGKAIYNGLRGCLKSINVMVHEA